MPGGSAILPSSFTCQTHRRSTRPDQAGSPGRGEDGQEATRAARPAARMPVAARQRATGGGLANRAGRGFAGLEPGRRLERRRGSDLPCRARSL